MHPLSTSAAARGVIIASAVVLSATMATAARADRIDDYLRAQMALNHIPGLSVAVVRDGKVVKLKSYGTANLEWGARTTPDTAFQIASATKTLTGTLLMLLVQEGRLGLDDSVTKYLPDAPDSWRPITVRHLASHASGIPDQVPEPAEKTPLAWVQAAAKLPLAYPPGQGSSYGLSDFIVLTCVLEQAASKPFADLLRGKIITPLGMASTRFENAWEGGPVRGSDIVPRRSGVYAGDAASGAQRNQVFQFPARAYSAGGLFSSAADLARLTAALDSGKLLKPEARDQMWSAAAPGGGRLNPFALGWVTGSHRGKRTVGHSGGPALADILRFPEERVTVIVLQNQQNMYPYLALGVADRYLALPAPPVKPAVPDSDRPATERHRGVAEGLLRGKFDDNWFAPAARGDGLSAIRYWMTAYVRSLATEPLRSFTLIEDKPSDGGGRMRVYRCVHGSQTALWTFPTDKDGQLVFLNVAPE